MIPPNRTTLTAASLIATASGRSKSWGRDRSIATDGLRPNTWSYGVPGKTQIELLVLLSEGCLRFSLMSDLLMQSSLLLFPVPASPFPVDGTATRCTSSLLDKKKKSKA
jgi:hypothetical protein